MHKPSLALTILFLTLLGTYVLFQPLKEVTSYQELAILPENTQVLAKGICIKQTFTQQTSYLTLSNNITLKVQGSQSYLNKTIQIQGTVDTFRYPKIQVTTITSLPK